ncbi:hypothetical protein RQP46_003960 [Phenoliferia psychrophenolica]
MKEVRLTLVSGRPTPLTPTLILNFLFYLIPGLFLTIPIHLLSHYVLNRKSPLVQSIGRPFYADIPVQLTRYLFARGTPAQARILCDRFRAYKLVHMMPEFRGFEKWLSFTEFNGIAGRWTAPPGTKRPDDDVVLYYVHGGAFVMDTGALAQVWAMQLAKELNIKRRTRFSVFALDYCLAPEFKYPSQLIEVLAGYHHLVNTLGISESKICADSSVGAVLDYLGAAHPENKTYLPSWNPYHWFVPPCDAPHASMLPVEGVKLSSADGTGIELLRSPYVNPTMCDDQEWIKAAFPSERRTMITWGGKEIFCDDVEEFAGKLASAGVNPVQVCKSLGVHDWVIYDQNLKSVPGVYITKSNGADRQRSWGIDKLSDFLQAGV